MSEKTICNLLNDMEKNDKNNKFNELKNKIREIFDKNIYKFYKSKENININNIFSNDNLDTLTNNLFNLYNKLLDDMEDNCNIYFKGLNPHYRIYPEQFSLLKKIVESLLIIKKKYSNFYNIKNRYDYLMYIDIYIFMFYQFQYSNERFTVHHIGDILIESTNWVNYYYYIICTEYELFKKIRFPNIKEKCVYHKNLHLYEIGNNTKYFINKDIINKLNNNELQSNKNHKPNIFTTIPKKKDDIKSKKIINNGKNVLKLLKNRHK